MITELTEVDVSASEPFPTMNHSSFISELTRTDKDVRNQTITADEPPCKLILISEYVISPMNEAVVVCVRECLVECVFPLLVFSWQYKQGIKSASVLLLYNTFMMTLFGHHNSKHSLLTKLLLKAYK